MNFYELETALFERNPLLEQRLGPPLSESGIKAVLKNAGLGAEAPPIVALYSWRNGTVLDQALMTSKTGFFPGEIYQLIKLDKAILHMDGHNETLFTSSPELAGRFLPVFWNGATNWLAVDLKKPESYPVVIVRFYKREASIKDGHYEPEIREKIPPPEVYFSFEDFVADVIRANRDNSPLTCFKQACV